MKNIFLPILLLFLLALTACGGNTSETVNAAGVTPGVEAAAPSAPDGNTKLSIAVRRADGLLNYAVKQFEETHEGVTVEIVPYGGEGDTGGITAEQFSQIINTAIMSGGGEDIIDASSLTWEKLADKNKLTDLSGYITLPPEEILTNILDTFRYNGKLYTFPTSFYYKSYRFTDEYAALETAPEGLTLDLLLSLKEKYPDANLIESGGNEGVLSMAANLFAIDFNAYVDLPNKKVDVDNEKFISMLTKLHSIRNELDRPESGKDYILDYYSMYSPVMTHVGTVDYSDMFLITNDKHNGSFTAFGIMPAINANSKNQALAGEFINSMLSEEIQSSPENTFTPVNLNAGRALASEMLETIKAEGNVPDGFDFEKNFEAFSEMAGRLTTAGISDRALLQFFYDELERFFSDTQTAEQTAANLQSRLTMYLNE